MARREPSVEHGRWNAVIVVRAIMLVIIGVLLMMTGVTGWQDTGAELDSVAAERDGVAYLGPLTTLVSELAEAQSVAARGGQVQPAQIGAAIVLVDRVDRRIGDRLGVGKRWKDTKKAINEVLAGRGGTIRAFDQYEELLALTRLLGTRIGDTSGLILDQALDVSYLADAAVRQLPGVMIDAGKAADFAALAAIDADLDTGTDPMSRMRVAVARYGVAVAAQDVGVGLAKAFGDKTSTTSGQIVAGQLDVFRSAVDSFVPSGTRLRGLDVRDTATLERTATMVRQATRPLIEAILDELDGVLRDRHNLAHQQRLRSGIMALIGVLLTLALLSHSLWMSLRAWQRTRKGQNGQAVAVDTEAAAPQGTEDSDTVPGGPLLAGSSAPSDSTSSGSVFSVPTPSASVPSVSVPSVSALTGSAPVGSGRIASRDLVSLEDLLRSTSTATGRRGGRDRDVG